MKGSNELLLNEATMMEIMQAWLDKAMPENKSKIVSIEGRKEQYCNIFTVKLTDKDPE